MLPTVRIMDWTAESRHVSVVFLNGDLLEKPLHKTMRLKLESHWRTQDVRNSRVVGYLMRRAPNRERSVLEPTKMNGVGDLKSVFT